MTLRNRLTALERRTEADKPATPALIVRTGESEQEAQQHYIERNGHAPPDDVLQINIIRAC